jgi:hypothetical protein
MIFFSAKREKSLQLIEIVTEMECVKSQFLDWLFVKESFQNRSLLAAENFLLLEGLGVSRL